MLASMLNVRLVARMPAQAVLAWGHKPSALRAERLTQKLGLPLLKAEDGFLRSFGPGSEFPALSAVVDTQGIYYDSTGPSDLETLLADDENLLVDTSHVDAAITMLINNQLSKYNHAPNVKLSISETADEAVLVIDQTYGDMSVQFGKANQQTFTHMLQAAIDENPGAQIWIKTHPEVSSGSKRGYLSQVKVRALPKGGQLLLLRELANPIGLLQQVNKVYVATSGMGFEALLCAKPVRCFGLPWYAGWGVTEDEQYCPRRIRTRSIHELFAAAYLRYTRYLNPVTHKQGSIFDVMAWLIRQRQMAGLI
jgi:capsular polysaccharide export protein